MHVKNQGHHSFALQRVIWYLLRILGYRPWGSLSDVCMRRNKWCLIALFYKKRSHRATKSAMGMLSSSRGFSIAACSDIPSNMRPLAWDAGMSCRLPHRRQCAV